MPAFLPPIFIYTLTFSSAFVFSHDPTPWDPTKASTPPHRHLERYGQHYLFIHNDELEHEIPPRISPFAAHTAYIIDKQPACRDS